MTAQDLPLTEFDDALADEPAKESALNLEAAEKIFAYFQQSPLFRWGDANNDCEDRANAACLLLDAWNIPNGKAWVFSGTFRGKDAGNLTNLWNYHVAAALPVQTQNGLSYMVIDPATSAQLIPLSDWALQITEAGKSYHFFKHGDYYIFPVGKIDRDNWHRRNKRNYNWTMQGLSGINGVSAKGRAQLAFFKKNVRHTADAFRKIKNERLVLHPQSPPA